MTKRNKGDEGFSSPSNRKKDHRSSAEAWTKRLLPPLPPAEYEALKESIRRFGVRVPSLWSKRRIIDGEHREQICDELGIFCPKEVREFASEAEEIQTAITLNSNRRHLSGKQKRELIAACLKADPRMNDRHVGDIIGVSKTTVASERARLEATGQIDKLTQRRGRDGKDRPTKYKRIIVSTLKEMEKSLEAIKNLPPSDKILDVTTACRRARRNVKKQAIAGKIITPLPSESIRLYHCPFQQLEKVAGIAPGSVQLVCSDIPYGKEFLPELDALAALAKRILVDGGLFVTYSGQYYLDQVMQAFGKHLNWRWMASMTWAGDGKPVHPLGLVNQWKPILIYSKGPWQKCGRWGDLLHAETKEKHWHDWGQPLDQVQRLVEYFSAPNDLVVDPCGGGFTTAIACRNLGRRFIGGDIEKQCVLAGQKRLAEE